MHKNSESRIQNLGKNLQPNPGFSLIELLVSMALLAILSGIGISIFAILNNSYTRANAISKMQTQGQQTLEQIERSVRSASAVEVYTSASGNISCTAGTCLSLSIPTASIENTLNGNCAKTVYTWTNASFVQGAQVNGKIARKSVNADDTPCGSDSVEMFDVDNQQGVSVEQNGGTAVFIKNSGSVPTIAISFILKQGSALYSGSGADNRANVPLKTTVGMREY